MRSFVRVAPCLVALACLAGCESHPAKGDSAKDPNAGASVSAAPDPRSFLTVTSPFPGWPKDGAGVKPGVWAKSASSGAYTAETVWAIVDQAGDIVKMEYVHPDNQGYVEAIVVNKSDGKVTKALAGKKGDKKLVAIKISPAGAATPPPAPKQTTTDEEVKVAAGTFKAKKMVSEGQLFDTTTWVGVEGDTAGVMLKTQVEQNVNELKVAPATEDVTIGGKGYKAVHLVYTDGMEQWTVTDPSLDAPFVSAGGSSIVKMVLGGTTTAKSWGEDAKPVLSWEE
jgi:hypothetical protein